MTASKINKSVVSNKDRVGGKIVLEKLGMWTGLLETREYLPFQIKFLLLLAKRYSIEK